MSAAMLIFLVCLVSVKLALASVCTEVETPRTSFAGFNSVDIQLSGNLAEPDKMRTVLVRNRSYGWQRLRCDSDDENIPEIRLIPGKSFSFGFDSSKTNSETRYWCTTDNNHFWARWDVYGSHASYGENNEDDRVYDFEIRNDGVYYKGQKIRNLNSGRYRYTLYENNEQFNPTGTTLSGFVDSGMCNDIPDFMESKTSVVTMCNNSCIILFSNLHCSGDCVRLQGPTRGCMNFWFWIFANKAKSVKGC